MLKQLSSSYCSKTIPSWASFNRIASIRICCSGISNHHTHSTCMEAEYVFGAYKIHPKEVFYSSHLSYAMVNLRPLLAGHILVSTALLLSYMNLGWCLHTHAYTRLRSFSILPTQEEFEDHIQKTDVYSFT
nr:PREDICTED: uncharacterized protein LOC108207829 [Daucus carota subsp. sativus]